VKGADGGVIRLIFQFKHGAAASAWGSPPLAAPEEEIRWLSARPLPHEIAAVIQRLIAVAPSGGD